MHAETPAVNVVSTPTTRQRNKESVRRHRSRNRRQGLCLCGRQVRQGVVGRDAQPKTCQTCFDRTRRQRGVYVAQARKPPVGKRTWTELRIEQDASTLAEWRAFCDEHQMPIEDAIEAAMDLYMALAAREETEQVQAEAHALFLKAS